MAGVATDSMVRTPPDSGTVMGEPGDSGPLSSGGVPAISVMPPTPTTSAPPSFELSEVKGTEDSGSLSENAVKSAPQAVQGTCCPCPCDVFKPVGAWNLSAFLPCVAVFGEKKKKKKKKKLRPTTFADKYELTGVLLGEGATSKVLECYPREDPSTLRAVKIMGTNESMSQYQIDTQRERVRKTGGLLLPIKLLPSFPPQVGSGSPCFFLLCDRYSVSWTF